jgi:hypothetical protein
MHKLLTLLFVIGAMLVIAFGAAISPPGADLTADEIFNITRPVNLNSTAVNVCMLLGRIQQLCYWREDPRGKNDRWVTGTEFAISSIKNNKFEIIAVPDNGRTIMSTLNGYSR